jgi:DNA-binding transcriptional LysR family regulator
VILESGNPQVLRQMVVLGMGWSVLPRAVAEVEGVRLRRPRGGPLAARDVCVARHRSRSEDPRAAAFLELARELR